MRIVRNIGTLKFKIKMKTVKYQKGGSVKRMQKGGVKPKTSKK